MLIANFVTRGTVRNHEACRVMPNSYPSDGIFNLHRRTIMDSFSCILFLRQLHLDLNMCLFHQVYAKITTFFSMKKSSVQLLLYVHVETFGGNRLGNDAKTSKRRQNVKIVILTSCTRVVLHHPCKTTFRFTDMSTVWVSCKVSEKKGVTSSLHGTHCVHTSMNVRKMNTLHRNVFVHYL